MAIREDNISQRKDKVRVTFAYSGQGMVEMIRKPEVIVVEIRDIAAARVFAAFVVWP
jgi:hypothetical protein